MVAVIALSRRLSRQYDMVITMASSTYALHIEPFTIIVQCRSSNVQQSMPDHRSASREGAYAHYLPII